MSLEGLKKGLEGMGWKFVKAISTPENPNLTERVKWATFLRNTCYTDTSCQRAVEYLERRTDLYIILAKDNTGREVLWFYGKGVNLSLYVPQKTSVEETSHKPKRASEDFPATANVGGTTYTLKALLHKDIVREWAKKEVERTSKEGGFVSETLQRLADGTLLMSSEYLALYSSGKDYLLVYKKLDGSLSGLSLSKEDYASLMKEKEEYEQRAGRKAPQRR